MNAKELRIGDMVMFLGKPVIVECFMTDSAFIRGLDNYTHGWTGYSEIDAIPLTKEILTKSGWIYYGTQRYWEYQGEYEFTLVHRAGKGFEIEQVPYITFQYVHELQHILWALGMDDKLKNIEL